MVRGTARPDAFRICLGADVSDAQFGLAVETIAAVFEQYPKLNDFV